MAEKADMCSRSLREDVIALLGPGIFLESIWGAIGRWIAETELIRIGFVFF